jgi:hypothetical protein
MDGNRELRQHVLAFQRNEITEPVRHLQNFDEHPFVGK